ncbi:MAG: hypothetical protein WCG92_02530 [Hyphomicrobiales bacterium]
MTEAVTAAEPARHAASLAVWDIPAATTAGEHFAVKVGAKSSGGCGLGGCRVDVLDSAGAVLASGQLGAEPWPGTDALFWSEIELCAPSAPGLMPLAVRFSADGLVEPHDSGASPFHVAVVAAPDHVLTVTVAAAGSPVADAIVRAGPIRATTDETGRARLHLAKGRHEIAVWKTGYDAPITPLTVEADATLRVEAKVLPEHDPDAIWTA